MFPVKLPIAGLAAAALLAAISCPASANQAGTDNPAQKPANATAAPAATPAGPVPATSIEGRSVSGGAMITPQDLELANGVHPGAEAMKPAAPTAK